MIEVNHHTLDNGLRIVHHEDKSTQMVALNLLYNVGARDEDPEHTGFAHLFEHLMFGGSINVPDYDTPVQNAGGENNAWTNNDITNYYITLPHQNVETGFWLESDRMLSLDFNPKKSGRAATGSHRRVQAAQPQPAVWRCFASDERTGIQAAPLPLAHHREGNQPHCKCHAR